MCDKQFYSEAACYIFTLKINKTSTCVLIFNKIGPQDRIIPHRFCLPKWICKSDSTTRRSVTFTRVAQQNVDGWNDTEWEETQLERGAMEKEKDSRYQRCIHPSFNRQTLTTLQDSIDTMSFDLHEEIPPRALKKIEVCFFGIQLLPQISWYSCLLKLCYISLVH